MTPFDGPPSLRGVAARKRKRAVKAPGKSGALGATAFHVYALATRILGIRDQFAQDIEHAEWLLATAQSTEANAAVWRTWIDNMKGHRERFERRLVEDPAAAILELDAMPPSRYRRPPGLGKNAVRDALLKAAVVHVHLWFRVRAGKREHPDKKRFPNVVANPSPVEALAPIAKARPVETIADLEKLATMHAVVERLEDDGPKYAAIALVALASGEGEQTVKRAAGS